MGVLPASQSFCQPASQAASQSARHHPGMSQRDATVYTVNQTTKINPILNKFTGKAFEEGFPNNGRFTTAHNGAVRGPLGA